MTALTQDRRVHLRQAEDRDIEIDAVRADIEREERLVGLRPDGFVTSVQIQRRRLQIVLVMLLVFVGLAATTIANDIWNNLKSQGTWLDPETIRIGMIIFAAGFAVYVLEKEYHLKRLSFLGRRAQELDLVLAERMLMSAVLAEATETVTTSIDLEEVLARILHEGDRLVGASLASIALVNDGGHLEEAWTRGVSVTDGRRLVAESVLLQVAVSREPLLLVGPLPSELTDQTRGPAPVASVALIPLVWADTVLGVLSVAALPGQRYSTGDLDVLTRLASPASQAIANARRYEAARLRDFDGIDTRREELREIGQSIRDAVTLARRDDLEPDEVSELFDRIDHQAVRLLEEVD
jgi:hypothetical protein